MFLPVLYYCKMDSMCKVHIHEFLNEGEVLDSLAALPVSSVDVEAFRSPNVTVSAIYPEADGYWTCFDVSFCPHYHSRVPAAACDAARSSTWFPVGATASRRRLPMRRR